LDFPIPLPGHPVSCIPVGMNAISDWRLLRTPCIEPSSFLSQASDEGQDQWHTECEQVVANWLAAIQAQARRVETRLQDARRSLAAARDARSGTRQDSSEP